MLDSFVNLAFLHTEMGLPPVPISHPHHFPIHLLPLRATEERPGAHASYEKILSRYISINAATLTDDNVENSCIGLEEVEPEVGLAAWADELSNLVSASVPVWGLPLTP
jgi:protein regulator of cytokinesis 1